MYEEMFTKRRLIVWSYANLRFKESLATKSPSHLAMLIYGKYTEEGELSSYLESASAEGTTG